MGAVSAGVQLQPTGLIPHATFQLTAQEPDCPMKTSLITGVSRGLGRAMTEVFIQRGHRVIGCCRSREVARSLQAQYAAPHHFSSVDVSSDAEVAAWAGLVLASHGAPYWLVNNAAVINQNAPLWRVPAREFSDVIDINIKGTANVLRHFLPAMIARLEGVIVNFSSGWGRSTDANVAPYCASKWAIEGLTQALAQELPAPLSAVALNPGVIQTDMLRSCFGSDAAGFPDPKVWALRAVPMILGLGRAENGQSLSVPQ